MKYPAFEVEEAREALHGVLTPGAHLRTVIRYVSSSGMTRWISLLWIYTDKEGRPVVWDLSYSAARVLGEPLSNQHRGIKVSGCGMDMGFDLVYRLGRVLWPNGFACVGERCPSNDHSNGDRDYTPDHAIHSDGGYALTQGWI